MEATLADVELGTALAHEVLGRTLDELSPQTRRFVGLMDEMVRQACAQQGIERSDYHFTQREVRHFTGWSDVQVKIHLRKLVELEYVLVHRAARGQSFLYELLYAGEGQDGRPFLMGLIDTEKLRRELGQGAYDGKWDRLLGRWDREKQGWDRSGNAQGSSKDQPGISAETPDEKAQDERFSSEEPQNAYKGAHYPSRSYATLSGRNGRGLHLAGQSAAQGG